MSPPRYRGLTPLPDCIWKRPYPHCGARQGALCFRPDTGRPMTTEVHYMRRDSYQQGDQRHVPRTPRVVPVRSESAKTGKT